MMISRLNAPVEIRQVLIGNWATVLLGPRQVGKTTLAREVADEYAGSIYLDLERASDSSKLEDAGAYERGRR